MSEPTPGLNLAPDPIFDRPLTYTEATVNGDEAVVYRASGFGYCIGALVRSRMGITASLPPEFMAERFQEGHDWEQRVLLAGLGVDWVTVTIDSELQRLGQIVEGNNGERQVEAQISWMDGKRVVRVHPDAIVRHQDRHLRVCEVKFLGPDMFNRIIAAVERDGMSGLGVGYAWQASIEMLATGLPLLYIIGQKKGKGETVELAGPPIVYEWTLDDAPYTMRDVKMRAAEVEGWVARGELPPCVVPFDFPCGYWQEHEARDKETIEDGVMVHLLESYTRNRGKAEAIDTEAKEIRRDIDARLVEIGSTGGQCAGWTISRTEARKGNVSWKKAWDSLDKKVTKGVDVDAFRGAEVEAGLRIEKVKGDD